MAQASLPFERRPAPPRARPARPAPTASAEAMALRRSISVYPLEGARYAGCWANRPSATPVEAIEASLVRIGLDPDRLEAGPGVNPDEIELRLKGDKPGLNPRHLLAVVRGVTVDEASTALRKLSGVRS